MVNWNPAWAKAIANIESRGSGGYRAIGPKTRSGDRAYGKYQVMGDNLPKWTKKYFGKVLSPQEFLNNPEAQEAVFRGEFGSYVNQYGNPQDAASMWFTGRPVSSGKKRSDGYNTGAQYVTKFNKFLGGSKMAQAQANPNILLSLFGGGNTSTPFVADEPKGILERLGLQKMVEGAEGETGQKFYNRDSFANMINRIGAAASGDPFVQQMAQDRIAGREAKKTANKTAEYLNSIGQTDLANAIGQGLIDGPSAMQRLFGLQDAQKAAELEQYRYYRDLADQRLDTQSDRDYKDTVRAEDREQELADIKSSREYQDAVREITQANSIELARIKDELQNNPNSLKNQLLLEQLNIQQTRLASDLATADVSRDATRANTAATQESTEAQRLANEAAKLELDAAKNPAPPVESSVEGPVVNPINIDTAAAGDPFGVGQRLLDVVRTNIFGGKGSSLVKEQSNLNAIDQLVRAGLSRNISDRGSVYSSEMLDKILPATGDSDAKMESKISSLIPILQQQLDLARDVVQNDVGSASQKGAARQVVAAFPDLIEALQLSQGTSTDLQPVTLDAESQAVLDAADAIIGE